MCALFCPASTLQQTAVRNINPICISLDVKRGLVTRSPVMINRDLREFPCQSVAFQPAVHDDAEDDGF